MVVHVVGQGKWPFLHDVLDPDEERANGGLLLLLLHGWFGILQMQVPELVGDDVEVANRELVAQLHLLSIVVDPEDETHLKHDESARKRPLLGAPTLRSIYSSNADQRIRAQGIRWVAHETWGLYWFRYMVPYIQFKVDLSLVICSVRGGAHCSHA